MQAVLISRNDSNGQLRSPGQAVIQDAHQTDFATQCCAVRSSQVLSMSHERAQKDQPLTVALLLDVATAICTSFAIAVDVDWEAAWELGPTALAKAAVMAVAVACIPRRS